MTDQTTWECVCVLCAGHGRKTTLNYGHCCQACEARLGNDLASIVANGDQCAVVERKRGSGASVPGYESEPPMSLDGLAPYLVGVRLNPGQEPPLVRTVADLLESWERIVRDLRGLTRYGPATAHHVGTEAGVLAAQATRQAVALLRGHLGWITTDPDFPLEDCADEIHRCASRMRALASPDEVRDRVVKCPTLAAADDAGGLTTCGHQLTVRTWAALDEAANGRRDWSIGEDVTCRRCGVTRSPEQLLHAAGKEDTWADVEALACYHGVGKSTLRRWAAAGRVRRQGGLYSWADVSDAISGSARVGT